MMHVVQAWSLLTMRHDQKTYGCNGDIFGDILHMFEKQMDATLPLQKLKSILLKGLIIIQSQTSLYHNKYVPKKHNASNGCCLRMSWPLHPTCTKRVYYYIIDRFRTLHDMSLYVHHDPSESASSNTAPVGPKSSVSWIREDSHTKKIYTENFKKTLNRHFQKQKIKEKGLFSVWINAIHPLNLRFGGCWRRFLLLQSIWRCFQHGAALRFIKSTSNPP